MTGKPSFGRKTGNMILTASWWREFPFRSQKPAATNEKESKFAVGLPVVQKSMILVVKDMETVRKIQDACQQALKSAIGDEAQVVSTYYYFFDLSGTEGQIDRFYDTYQEAVPDFAFTSSIYEEREDFYGLYGSIVFIGIFMAAMFLTATVLIMYYKQITEGYDDKERFLIMQNVGLGEKEVKQTIRKQVLLVFFLPLLTAVIHMAVAYKALALMMQGFSCTIRICSLVLGDDGGGVWGGSISRCIGGRRRLIIRL